ncbi:hypothetical protein HYW60_03490 [Candidatus Kaiserbacteria bacterium]|nr:hypothetical protein [Candidatus Kaiserbacteria bacterium]
MQRKTTVAAVAHDGAFPLIDVLRKRLSAISMLNFPNKKGEVASVANVTHTLVNKADMLLILAGEASARKGSAPAEVEKMILRQAQRYARPCMLALLGPAPAYLHEVGSTISGVILPSRSAFEDLLDACPRAEQLLLNDIPGIAQHIWLHAKCPPGEAGLDLLSPPSGRWDGGAGWAY